MLSRKGIYAVGTSSVDVTETILMQTSPFKILSIKRDLGLDFPNFKGNISLIVIYEDVNAKFLLHVQLLSYLSKKDLYQHFLAKNVSH